MSFTTRIALSLLLVCSASVSAEGLEHIRESGELELCANPTQMPFSGRDNGAQGFQVDLARALADQLGVSLNIAWIQYRHEAKRTSCDFYAGVARLPERESKYLRLSDPFMRLETVLVTRAEAESPVTTLADLQTRVVGVASGSIAAHRLARQGVELAVRFKDEASRVQAVAAGEIDAAIVSNVSAGWFNRQQGPVLRVYDAEALLGVELNYDYAFGWRKGDAATDAELNQVLQTMKQDGSLNAVLDSYGLAHE